MMRGPLPTIGNLPSRALGAVERRDLNGSPGHDLRARDGTPLASLRLSQVRAELAAMGFPVINYPSLGKSNLLALAAGFFAKAKPEFDPEENLRKMVAK